MPSQFKKNLAPVYARLLTIIASLYKIALTATGKTRKREAPLRIVLLVSRPLDVELLINIHEKAKLRNDLSPSVWMLKKCDKRFPEVLPLLKEKQVVVDQLVSFVRPLALLRELMRADVFLSTVESTAAAHKLPYIITRMANAAGVSTYTLQHGFENIGLSYCDETHGPDVKFAAKTILTWGQTEELPTWVKKDTLAKAIAVGCPKKIVILKNDPALDTGERPIIGVFDNLHWHRYDEKYCSTFLRNLQDISEQRQEFRFILKSHPIAVRRRNKELATLLHNMENVDVADLLGEEDLTTPWLLSRAMGVITTPSTIALDGALAKVPVAVSRYGLDLSYYSPLCLLDGLEDWQGFLDCLLEKSENSRLKRNGERFLSRVLIGGDPATKIINLMTREG
jgi:hypothetical protein